MAFLILLLFFALHLIQGDENKGVPRRSLAVIDPGEDPILSFAGYIPQTPTVDASRIDLDQAAILQAFSFLSFFDAQKIYEDGAHSFAVATIHLDTPLQRDMPSNSVVSAISQVNSTIRAYLSEDTFAGANSLTLVYPVPTDNDSIVCQVGGNLIPQLDGCLPSTGIVTIGGLLALSYTYDPLLENRNLRSIQSISSSNEIFKDCDECPLPTYQRFINYYGKFAYADELVISVMEGKSTNLDNGNVDASQLSAVARAELASRLTVYINVWIAVAAILEYSVEQCFNLPIAAVSYWDEAAAFYVGSLEGTDGSGDGNLLYNVADELCGLFNTCTDSGTSIVNVQVLEALKSGQTKLTQSDCSGTKDVKDGIIRLMTIPLIQGTLFFALMPDKSEREAAAGYAFTAALLPLIYSCDKEDATSIYNAVRIPISTTSLVLTQLPSASVLETLSNHYECLGVTCMDVGDLNGTDLCGNDEFSPTTSPIPNSSASRFHSMPILAILLISLLIYAC